MHRLVGDRCQRGRSTSTIDCYKAVTSGCGRYRLTRYSVGPGTRGSKRPTVAGLMLMLQTYKSPSAQVGEDGAIQYAPNSAQPSFTDLYATVIGFLRRQFVLVLWVVLLTIGLGAAYLFTTPPLYSAQAELMIDTGKIQVLKQSILGDELNWQMIDSQIEILKSEHLALTIIKNLHLTQDPEFIAPA